MGYIPRLTSVVHVSEGRVDKLAKVARPLGYVHQEGDGVVSTAHQVQQGFGQAGLPCGGFWIEEERANRGKERKC